MQAPEELLTEHFDRIQEHFPDIYKALLCSLHIIAKYRDLLGQRKKLDAALAKNYSAQNSIITLHRVLQADQANIHAIFAVSNTILEGRHAALIATLSAQQMDGLNDAFDKIEQQAQANLAKIFISDQLDIGLMTAALHEEKQKLLQSLLGDFRGAQENLYQQIIAWENNKKLQIRKLKRSLWPSLAWYAYRGICLIRDNTFAIATASVAGVLGKKTGQAIATIKIDPQTLHNQLWLLTVASCGLYRLLRPVEYSVPDQFSFVVIASTLTSLIGKNIAQALGLDITIKIDQRHVQYFKWGCYAIGGGIGIYVTYAAGVGFVAKIGITNAAFAAMQWLAKSTPNPKTALLIPSRAEIIRPIITNHPFVSTTTTVLIHGFEAWYRQDLTKMLGALPVLAGNLLCKGGLHLYYRKKPKDEAHYENRLLASFILTTASGYLLGYFAELTIVGVYQEYRLQQETLRKIHQRCAEKGLSCSTQATDLWASMWHGGSFWRKDSQLSPFNITVKNGSTTHESTCVVLPKALMAQNNGSNVNCATFTHSHADTVTDDYPRDVLQLPNPPA